MDLEEPLGFVTLECEDRVQWCLAIERERGNEGREETGGRGKKRGKRSREACRPVVNAQIIVRYTD